MAHAISFSVGQSIASPPARNAPPTRPSRRHAGTLRARYESAMHSDESKKHWRFADGLSARAANSKEVRMPIVQRARYEHQNNPICNGMINTVANDIVGRGTTLQAGMKNDEWNRLLEERWNEWCCEVALRKILRTAVKAKKVDGESFILKKTDPDMDCPVKLYPFGVETDQVTSLNGLDVKAGFAVDGVELNALGRPIAYHVLKRHPGDVSGVRTRFAPMTQDVIARRFVLHWYRCDRPGQVRGISEIAPSLNTMANLRRFDKATLGAAEWAATMSALLFTNLTPDDEDTPLGAPFDTWEIEQGVNVMPEGYEPKQLQPTQPIDTHKEYTTTVIGQCARPLDMPYNRAMCNSAGYNFSSGRLDFLPYYRMIDIERQDCDEIILEPLFRDWYDEAIMIPGYLPDGMILQYPRADLIPHRFSWPAMDSIDPKKDADADAGNLANGTVSVPELCARENKDWRTMLREKAMVKVEEIALAKELGLDPNWNSPATLAMPKAPANPTPPEPGSAEQDQQQEEAAAAA
jgi:capsid protein